MNLEPSVSGESSVDPPQNKMITRFFDNQKIGIKFFSSYIIDDLINNYIFVYQKTMHGEDWKDAVKRNISSLFNQFFTREYLISKRNFDRMMTEDGYVYWSLPKTSDLVLPQSSAQSSAQLALDYDTKDEPVADEFVEDESVVNEPVADEPETFEDEETTSEENCPLLEDILASDKINDPIQRIIDNYSNIDLFGIDQVQFTATKSGKKITITIANA
jgi:hypothetical protein